MATPPPLTVLRVFTAWRPQPGVLAAAVVLGGGYAAAVARTRRAGRPWPRVRITCWAAGIATILLVGCSFLGVYDNTLFWVRAVQNIVLLMVVLPRFGALFVASGSALPASTALVLSLSNTLRTFAAPIVIALVMLSAFIIWLATSRDAASTRSRLFLGTPLVSGFTVTFCQ